MNLKLVGHDYKYAVEQIMLALFPGERPEYSDANASGSDELFSESSLRLGPTFAQAVTLMRCGATVSRGYARVGRNKLTGKLATDRALQRIIKQSFYRAATRFIEAPPEWGSLTGIRPAKLAAAALESGSSAKAAAARLVREFFVSPERAAICVDAAQASLALKRDLGPQDIALYIGIPFCPTRCAYCSFVSNSVEKSFGLVEPFVGTLLSEISVAAETARALGLRIVSVYIGGGTPTALPDQALEAVISRLGTSFDLSGAREYTVEAGRPDTITEKKLEILARLGVGRVCVNPQSMSESVLSAIGRRHSPADVTEAVRLVRSAGAADSGACTADSGACTADSSVCAMDSSRRNAQLPETPFPSGIALNMDVIAGLPADTPEGFAHTLDTVLELLPENVTVHTLSLKKGSRIMLEGTAIPSGAQVAGMLEYAARRLRERGYRPYYLYRQKYTSGGFENTGWSLPGHECLYNMCMMEELCTVLALGGGGVTKLVSPDGRIERVFNAKYPREYILHAGKIADKYKRIEQWVSGKIER